MVEDRLMMILALTLELLGALIILVSKIRSRRQTNHKAAMHKANAALDTNGDILGFSLFAIGLAIQIWLLI